MEQQSNFHLENGIISSDGGPNYYGSLENEQNKPMEIDET